MHIVNVQKWVWYSDIIRLSSIIRDFINTWNKIRNYKKYLVTSLWPLLYIQLELEHTRCTAVTLASSNIVPVPRLDWIACISLNWYELQMDGSSISGDYFFLLSHFTRKFSQLWVQQLFFQIPAQFAFSIAFSERDGQIAKDYAICIHLACYHLLLQPVVIATSFGRYTSLGLIFTH